MMATLKLLFQVKSRPESATIEKLKKEGKARTKGVPGISQVPRATLTYSK
ncbi:UNVERIFIED_CONTAM: hypothetical protein Slati_2672100 [Sesamum latifolium]|uniref:Uncharacterized protein n=1 Tax=Sesamum latifolium TaxID=2727402 RepID=A0AAW2VVR2_9LAMI